MKASAFEVVDLLETVPKLVRSGPPKRPRGRGLSLAPAVAGSSAGASPGAGRPMQPRRFAYRAAVLRLTAARRGGPPRLPLPFLR